MAQRDPVLIVMRSIRVRRPDGRVVHIAPGYKGDVASDHIKSLVSKDQLDQMKKSGRIVEETPPWD